MLIEFAPAKINLYLHVTGRREDGFHNLDSLVAFAGVGDQIRLEPAPQFSFTVNGPQAAALADHPVEDNLAFKAAHTLAELTGKPLDVAITLTKNLPVAAGIGGGSSDAAAVLRVLARHWGMSPDEGTIFKAGAKHGQDVPVCLKIVNNYMTAEGTLPAQHDLPRVALVLVNPNQALPTPAVFCAFKESGASFITPARLTKEPVDVADLVDQLKQRTNSLYNAACQIMPDVGIIKSVLESASGCLLARMSGSGATCFGLFDSDDSAQIAARQIKTQTPSWWVIATYLPYQPNHT